MSCQGSQEVVTYGVGTVPYVGLSFLWESRIARFLAKLIASINANQSIATQKTTLCNQLSCATGCECETSVFEDPAAYGNNPTVNWMSTQTGWFGVSIAGRWTVSYAYVVKAECVDAKDLEGIAPITGATVTEQ